MAENNKPKPGTVYPAEPRKRLPGYLHDLLSATKIDYELVAAQCARGYDYKLETHNDAEIYVEDIVPDIATYNAQWPDDPEIKRSEEERKKRQGENVEEPVEGGVK